MLFEKGSPETRDCMERVDARNLLKDRMPVIM